MTGIAGKTRIEASFFFEDTKDQVEATKAVKKDASKISNWAKDKNVPVIMSEVGCIGYVDGKTEGPKNPEDCGKYAQDLYKFYVLNNIPITWWALEKEKTIYTNKDKFEYLSLLHCNFW